MKKLLIGVLTLFVVLSLTLTPANAKWKSEQNAGFHGQMGKVRIELSAYDIDLSEDPLLPGWSGSFSLDVTNTGNLPVVLSYTIVDAPTFLTITVTIPGGNVLVGETVSVPVTVSIPEDVDQAFADTAADFTVTFTGDQL